MNKQQQINYKRFDTVLIGSSNIASLVFRGANGVKLVNFGEDSTYSAYFCTGRNVEIGKHYTKEASFIGWLKVYDDWELSFHNDKYDHYDIYTAGMQGVIIHAYND